MRKTAAKISLLMLVALVMVFSIWAPELLSKYKDKKILDELHTQKAEAEGEGYRYALAGHEKLYILSKCLSSQNRPESEQNALSRNAAAEYGEKEGTYAFIINHRGPSEKQITNEEIYEACSNEIKVLQELEILPDTVKKVDAESYQAVLYSAIDVLEPRNNLAVWKLSLSNMHKNSDKQNKMMDLYIDGDSGKIYEFYVRTELAWENIDPDRIVEKWSEYMGLQPPKEYAAENPLLETTPYFKKYEFLGKEEEKTIVTIGFYEGINEFFLKVSK